MDDGPSQIAKNVQKERRGEKNLKQKRTRAKCETLTEPVKNREIQGEVIIDSEETGKGIMLSGRGKCAGSSSKWHPKQRLEKEAPTCQGHFGRLVKEGGREAKFQALENPWGISRKRNIPQSLQGKKSEKWEQTTKEPKSHWRKRVFNTTPLKKKVTRE